MKVSPTTLALVLVTMAVALTALELLGPTSCPWASVTSALASALPNLDAAAAANAAAPAAGTKGIKPSEGASKPFPADARPHEVQGCKHVIIGAGWGGAYLAHRLSEIASLEGQHNPHHIKTAEVCVFEQLDRVGGRAYSKHGIPNMQDVRIDLGAYRFDTHAMPLIKHVVVDDLHLATKCYDADACDEKSGKLVVVEDVYGNNRGYATGVEEALRAFVAKGGRLFLNHTLVDVQRAKSTLATAPSPALLKFRYNNQILQLTATNAFLNMPLASLHHLDKGNVIFNEAEHSSSQVKEALQLPTEQPAAKVFLIYGHAAWRSHPLLLQGDVLDRSSHPALVGRLHDFQGKCFNDVSECWGALLATYTFNLSEVKYFAEFQGSWSDPYVYLANGGPDDNVNSAPNPPVNAVSMIRALHAKLMKAMKEKDPEFNPAIVPEPLGAALGIWWSRDMSPKVLLPSFSFIGATLPHSTNVDPTHALRNAVSRPVKGMNLFIVNEAFSGGDGWAHPSIVMAERVLWQHFQSKPAWVVTCPDDCLYGDPDAPSCQDCTSDTFWQYTINNFPTMCASKNPDECASPEAAPQSPMHKQPKPPAQPSPPPASADSSCSAAYEFPPESPQVSAAWSWPTSDLLEITMQATDGTWAGIGFGADMTDAPIVMVVGENKAEFRWAQGYKEPKFICSVDAKASSTCASGDVSFKPFAAVKAAHAAALPDGRTLFTLVVQLSMSDPSSAVRLNEDGGLKPVPIMFASSHGPWRGKGKPNTVEESAEAPLPQHTFQVAAVLPLSCGRHIIPSFTRDVLPLFRAKDISAMRFWGDMSNCTFVQKSANEILSRVKDRTIHRLETGMPVDTAWSLQAIQTFEAWMKLDPPENCAASGTRRYFDTDVKKLFRAKDREDMLFIFDLCNCEDVQKNAAGILKAVSQGSMPCAASGAKWDPEMVQVFRDWMALDKPCTAPEDHIEDKNLKDQEGCSVLSDREAFFRGMNADTFPEYEDRLWVTVQSYLAKARKSMENPPSDLAHWKLLPREKYSLEAVSRVLDDLYAELAKTATEAYDPLADEFGTVETATLYIRNMAPYSMNDGKWISRCCPSGPLDDIHAMLWGILNEEMGMGTTNLNHCNVYEDLLKSVGVFLPPIASRDFAYHPDIIDEAFTRPAYAVLLSVFTYKLFPELLGSTVQIEWQALGGVQLAQRCEYLGMDPLYYKLHIGIDNSVAGHGWRAKRAAFLYLDKVRLEQGLDAEYEAYKRIWTGFVTFDGGADSLKTKLTAAAQSLRDQPARRVMEMMDRKKTYGSMNHRNKTLGNQLINKLFSDPATFLKELRLSAWVVPGFPQYSPFLDYLTTFQGPMFKVFDDADLEVWRDWIIYLGQAQPAQQGEIDIADAVANALLRVRRVAGRSVKHHGLIKIWGPSPYDPHMEIEQTVAAWLSTARHGDASHMLRALVHPRNGLITPENPNASSFFTTVLRPGGPMGATFGRVAAVTKATKEINGKLVIEDQTWTFTDIFKEWVAQGCPIKAPGELGFGEKACGKPQEGGDGHAHPHLTKSLFEAVARGPAARVQLDKHTYKMFPEPVEASVQPEILREVSKRAFVH